MAKQRMTLEVAGREVSVSNPDKVYFPEAGYTKLDVVRYYLEVAEGALAAAGGRPLVMKRYVDGIKKERSIRSVHPNRGPGGSRP